MPLRRLLPLFLLELLIFFAMPPPAARSGLRQMIFS